MEYIRVSLSCERFYHSFCLNSPVDPNDLSALMKDIPSDLRHQIMDDAAAESSASEKEKIVTAKIEVKEEKKEQIKAEDPPETDKKEVQVQIKKEPEEKIEQKDVQNKQQSAPQAEKKGIKAAVPSRTSESPVNPVVGRKESKISVIKSRLTPSRVISLMKSVKKDIGKKTFGSKDNGKKNPNEKDNKPETGDQKEKGLELKRGAQGENKADQVLKDNPKAQKDNLQEDDRETVADIEEDKKEKLESSPKEVNLEEEMKESVQQPLPSDANTTAFNTDPTPDPVEEQPNQSVEDENKDTSPASNSLPEQLPESREREEESPSPTDILKESIQADVEPSKDLNKEREISTPRDSPSPLLPVNHNRSRSMTPTVAELCRLNTEYETSPWSRLKSFLQLIRSGPLPHTCRKIKRNLAFSQLIAGPSFDSVVIEYAHLVVDTAIELLSMYYPEADKGENDDKNE